MWAVGYYSEYWPTDYWPSIEQPSGYYFTGTNEPVYTHSGVFSIRYLFSGVNSPLYGHSGEMDADIPIPYSVFSVDYSDESSPLTKGLSGYSAGSTPYGKTASVSSDADTPYRRADE